MKSSSQLLVLGVLWPLSTAAADGAAAPQAPALPDTSQWKCESCPAQPAVTGSIEAGAGYVSDNSAKFGEYNGLDQRGGVLLAGGGVRVRAEDGSYVDAQASNLGLGTRAIGLESGRQGAYSLRLVYEDLPHILTDSARTPYLGNGGGTLTLPAGFAAANTTLMPLAATLRPVELETNRQRIGLAGSWLATPQWTYSVSVRHELKDGTKRTAGAFFVNAAQLAEPVHYSTDQIDASASYTGERLQLKLGYYGSLFRNGNSALTWQNPYTGIPGNPAAGQLALAPDNQFHQLLASAGYQVSDRTRATADVSVGRMTQNDSFLAPTVNAAIASPALPRASLDGEATTLNANVRLISSLTDTVRVHAAYSHNERDNKTPQSAYNWVSTDMFLAGARVNLPYSFKQDKVSVSADYRATAALRASIGLDHDANKRTFQEVDTTRENTLWGKLGSRVLDNVDLTLKLAHAERRHGGTYTPITFGGVPLENPLLRKYHLANRTRDTIALRADIAPADSVNVGLGVSNSRDDYSASAIGLTKGTSLAVNGDISVAFTEDTSVHFFASREEMRSRQTNSQTFSAPDWIGNNKDTVDFYGVGIRHAAIKNKLDIGADIGQMRTSSEVSVNVGAGNPNFPDMSSTRDTLKVYATYKVKDNVSLNATWWHERFGSRNWLLDDVQPGTIPNVLAFGELAPRYNVNFLSFTVRYKF